MSKEALKSRRGKHDSGCPYGRVPQSREQYSPRLPLRDSETSSLNLSVALVAHALDHFQHFAPGGELAPGPALVVVHGAHEFDFVVGIVAFAGRRVDLPAAFDFTSGTDAPFLFGANRGAVRIAAVGKTT